MVDIQLTHTQYTQKARMTTLHDDPIQFAVTSDAWHEHVLDHDIACIAQPQIGDRNIYSVYKPADLLLEVV